MTKPIKVSEKLDEGLIDAIQLENMKFGSIPNNVGYPKGMQGVTRKLTKKDLKQQAANLAIYSQQQKR